MTILRSALNAALGLVSKPALLINGHLKIISANQKFLSVFNFSEKELFDISLPLVRNDLFFGAGLLTFIDQAKSKKENTFSSPASGITNKILQIEITRFFDEYSNNFFIISIDSEISQTELILKDEVKLREARLRSLISILEFETDNIQDFLDFSLSEAIKLTQSKLGYIYYYNEDRKEFTLNSWSKEVMKECTIVEYETTYQLSETGIWGEAVRQRKEIIVNDYHAANPLKKGYPKGHAPLHNFMTLPIFSANRIVAVVGLANKEQDYNQTDVLQIKLLMNSVWKEVEKKKSQDELKDMQSALHASLNELYVFDIKTLKFDYVSRGAATNLGYSNTDLTHMSPLDIISNIDESRFRSILEPLISGKRSVIYFEGKHLRKDGSEYPIEVNLQLFKQKNRNVILAMIVDITSKKWAEKALIANEKSIKNLNREFQAILDAIPDCLYLLSNDLKVVWANQGAGKNFNVKPEDLVGKKCHELWFSSNKQCEICPVRKSLKTRELASKTLQTPDGRTWDFRTVPITDDKGNVQGVVQLGRDISERNKLEEQLLHSQKMDAVGRLAGGVAHDFNNMLNVIIGYSEFAKDRVDPKTPLYHDLDEILSAAKRSISLTKQLLAFARKQTITPSVVDINRLISDLEKMLKRLIGENISLKFIPGNDIWSVKVDSSQIDQILANLSVNARDAIGAAGHITIETSNIHLEKDFPSKNVDFQPGDYVVINFSDSGEGIEKKVLDSIFEPFFTTKPKGEGTGLGLATVYGIVKQNRGMINVYSEVGRGTTFKIYLPRHQGSLTKIQTSEKANQITGTETVLIVEDEVQFLILCKKWLSKRGFNVLSASCPSEAISIAKENSDKIQILVTDVILPEMNGNILGEKLKEIIPGLKTLYMSGYTSTAIEKQGITDIGKDFIQKPFNFSTFGQTIRSILDR